jgi:Tfp pilus assembly protein PilF
MTEEFGYLANFRRGLLLRASGRFADACAYFRCAIEADPGQAEAYLALAMALAEIRGGMNESLLAIERALSLNPDSAEILGSKAYLLAHYGQYELATSVAAIALQRDPTCHIALLARTNAYTKMDLWNEAESSARRMLELNPHDTSALNLLAQALRFLGRRRQSQETIARVLSQTPNDPFSQSNAGYEALNANRQWQARQHFLNALRADPTSDFARIGLLRSYRECAWIYRVQLRALFFFSNHWENSTVLRFALVALTICTFGLFFVFLFIYLLTVLAFHPIANFFLLFNRTARHAFTPEERRNAFLTGVIIAAGLLALAIWSPQDGFVIYGGGLLIYAVLFSFSCGLDALEGWRHAPPTVRSASPT